MQEAFLHYIWQFKKFDTAGLKSTRGEGITLRNTGHPNLHGGPDFFNAQLEIDGILWVGNVELHIKSSDWYVHHHETDQAYDNVILHVVYEHDTDIFRKNNSVIPTVELKDIIHSKVFHNYQHLLMAPHKWINCESDFANVDDFIRDNWLERLYIERLERKSKTIEALLVATKNDWEAVLFTLLAKNFGLKINGDAFLSMAKSFDFSIIRKLHSQPLQLEALLFGQAGVLDKDLEESYYLSLVKEYQFLKQKFNLSTTHVIPLQYFRLRPPNFPTIRLSQLAMLYHHHPNFFGKLMAAETLEDLYLLFRVGTSEFWTTHFTFEKTSKLSKKVLTNSFIDLLLINTVLPLKFSYLKHHGKNPTELNLQLAQMISPEKNGIIAAFDTLKPLASNAMITQALLQLKTEYCDKNKCMSCAIGNSILAK